MHPTDLDIELYLVGDLGAADAARVEDAANASPELAAYLASRRSDQAAFAISRPRLSFDGATDGGNATTTPSWKRLVDLFWAPASLFATAAAVLVFVALPNASDTGTHGGNNVTARGDALVARLIAKRDDVVFHVSPTTPLRPKDQLRVEVENDGDSRCTMIGFDAVGAAFVLYDAVPMASGKQIFRDSIVLDDKPGREHLLVACVPEKDTAAESAVAPKALINAYRRHQLDGANAAVRLTDLTYEKEPAPSTPATP